MQYSTVVEGTASDPDGDDLDYRWLEGETPLQGWQSVGANGEAFLDVATVDPSLDSGPHTLTLEVSDGEDVSSDEMVLTVLTPAMTLENIADELQSTMDSYSGTSLLDKLEDVLAKVETALDELEKSPPDNQAAVGNIDGAVGDLEAAVIEWLNPDQGAQLMDCLAGIARQLAVDALNYAIDHGGKSDEIGDAQEYLAEGDTLRASEAYKDVVNKYKDALAKAESAVS